MHSAHEVWLTEAVLIEIANALASSNRSAAVAFINSCYFTPNVRVVSVDSKLLKRAVDSLSSARRRLSARDTRSITVMNARSEKRSRTFAVGMIRTNSCTPKDCSKR
ncbi:MAG: hypothetical protein O8C62_01705 [Candidatus Methanoperedens sp.]|nr:hypothetical protein [Candidatus Methanoperedens sp.]